MLLVESNNIDYMKLRVLKRGKLYYPQYKKKNYYSSCWVNFGKPSIRFDKQQLAIDFVKLIEQSVILSPPLEIVYQNFND